MKKKNLYAPNPTVAHTQQSVCIRVNKGAGWSILTAALKQPQTANGRSPQTLKAAVGVDARLRAEDGVGLFGERLYAQMLKQSAGEAGGLYHLLGVQLRERERQRKPITDGTNFQMKGKSMCFLKNSWRRKEGRWEKPLPGSITPFVREQS